MGYKGAIFDLDGTLINSIEDIGNSLNKVLSKHDLPELTMQDYTDRIGQGLHQLVIDSTPVNTDDKLIEIIFAEFVDDYGHNYNIKTKAYDGILEMLETLVSNGVKVGVNSNKKHEFTIDLVKTIFPHIEFELVLGDREHVKKKPDPQSALEIIDAMRLKKEEVIYIGDTDHDIHTAQNAGIDSIGVSWGYRSLEVLRKEGATYTVSKVEEIIEIIS